MDWPERYRSGEHIQVWSELQALGPSVLQSQYRKMARDVARETMERCRRNVEALFAALPQIGYRFQSAPEPPVPDYAAELRFEAALQYVRSSGRKYAANPWAHPALAWIDREGLEIPAHLRNGRPGRSNYRPPSAGTLELLDQWEQRLDSHLALAVRSWFEIVGSVDLAGSHPLLNPEGAVRSLRVVLAGDSAGLTHFANPGEDFVASLRHVFAWGGFPGWEGHPDPPERELAWLRSKLEPF